MNKDVYELAHRITEDYFNSCMMGVMGAKIVGHYYAHDCPINVPEGIYC